MNIQLDPETLKSIVAEAIMASLDDKKREALISGAISHLLTPNTERYGSQKSPLDDAFRYAVQQVAQKIATEMIANDEVVKTKIRTLLNEAMLRVMETNREATINKLANAITEGMAYRNS